MENIANIQGTDGGSVTVGLPRALSDLRSFLHGYRIKTRDYSLVTRASVIVQHIDTGGTEWGAVTTRAARELAELDPSLSWLPGWKPRERIQALRKGDGT